MTLKRKPKTFKESIKEDLVHLFQYFVFASLGCLFFFAWYAVRVIFTITAMIPLVAGIAFILVPPQVVGTVDPAIIEPVRYVSIITGALLILYALYEMWNIWQRGHYDIDFMTDDEQKNVFDKIYSNKTWLARKAGLEPYYGKHVLMPDDGEPIAVAEDSAFDFGEVYDDDDWHEYFGVEQKRMLKG